jgi:N6-adenosine-specific RNA methylase IME4
MDAPLAVYDRRAEAVGFHALANLFPLIEGAEFDELVADVGAHGVQEPAWVYQGQILDGRNRYRAAQAAGVPCPTRSYEGDDPIGFVISMNLKRRHLSESQRAMVAAKLATLRDGQRADLVEGLPIGRASALLNVGERSVARAREVQVQGVPELIRAVETDEVSVSAAADIATLPIEEQRAILTKIDNREIVRAAQAIRAIKSESRRVERLANLAEIAKGNTELPTSIKYPIIYADPPWKFEGYTSEEDYERAPRYPTMTFGELTALPVPACETAMMFLWTTSAHADLAFQLLRAWDFNYSTSAVWVKTDCQPGLGHIFRQQHETLLVGRRGDFPAPPPSSRLSSVIMAPRREHSRKPDEVYELIERMYPALPKIELFARTRRPGWDAWGNEAPPPLCKVRS